MSYYIVNATGQQEGPYTAEWIRSHATTTTLVSHQQQWLQYSRHPDFIRRTPSPHWSLLNLLLPGVGQIVFGQVLKGFLIIAVEIITFATFWGPLVVMVLAIIDGYKVGNKLRRTGSVGKWEFFPD